MRGVSSVLFHRRKISFWKFDIASQSYMYIFKEIIVVPLQLLKWLMLLKVWDMWCLVAVAIAYCRLEREGKLEAALKCYREALADNPHQETARERLKIITTALEKQVGIDHLRAVVFGSTAMLKLPPLPFAVLLSSAVLDFFPAQYYHCCWWQISPTGCLDTGLYYCSSISKLVLLGVGSITHLRENWYI